MSRCRFVGRPPVPFLPFYLDLNKLTPEGAREIEEAARTSERAPVDPTPEVQPATSVTVQLRGLHFPPHVILCQRPLFHGLLVSLRLSDVPR